MPLTPKEKQLLKARAHKLKPIVAIGHQGLTEAVKKETDRALNDHELIKVRIQAENREERRTFYRELCDTLSANEVQLIGNIGIIFRKKDLI